MAKNTSINIPKSSFQRGYSIVIAANDSTALSKSMADYICDGTDDQSEINTAIDSLSAGGEIHLMEGIYTLSATITMASNITLSGCGNATVLKLKNGINANCNIVSIVSPDNLSGRKENIIICNIKLDGNKSNNSSGTQNGIYIHGDCRNISIDNIFVTSLRNDGLNSSCVNGQVVIDNLRVNNSNFIDNDGSGVFHSTNYSAEYEWYTNRYIGCRFENNALWGINLQNSGDIYNCHALNNIVGGIAGRSIASCFARYTNSPPTYSGSSHIGLSASYGLYSSISEGYNIGSSSGILVGNRIVAKVIAATMGSYVVGNYFSVNPTTASGQCCFKPENANALISGNIFNIGANNYCIKLTHGWANICNNTFNGTSSACIKVDNTYCYYSHISNNTFSGGSVGIDNTVGCANIRVLNNTGNGVTTLISGSVLETAGNVKL